MNTKRLSAKVEKALSDQMNKKFMHHVFYRMESGQMIKAIRELPIFFTVMPRKRTIRSNSWNTF
jgi:hypothetical protein